jgi:hypothetical protein
MEVGDISEVSGDSWGLGHTTGGDDGWGTGRELDTVMVGRQDRTEQDEWVEPTWTGSASVTTHGSTMGCGKYTGRARVM